ncbi:hypothetical protein AURDEDRAFT_116588 [Auricularia subglabra TFB-10046 SS5]|nr:hypothetical protein AURDEDRAFT_116588 [Auricularia subglabra TFB-10046 SS5]
MAASNFNARSLVALPDKARLLQEYGGKKLADLPTPSFVVDRAIVAANCAYMHETAKKWDAHFRAHVKTHKTVEGTVLQLKSASNTTNAVVVSTLMEAWHIVNSGLVKDHTINDILYGVPVGINKIPDLAELSDEIRPFNAELRLMVDNIAQIRALEAFDAANPRVARWSVFVKVDAGLKRAGIVPSTPAMTEFLTAVLASPSISVYGFYCHSGNAYASKNTAEAQKYLSSELQAVNDAAAEALQLLAKTPNAHQSPFILSVGSTPSTHAAGFDEVRESLKRVLNGTIELHAGNYPFKDLQQLATGMIKEEQIASFVLSQVIAYYPGRSDDGGDEAMCDVGGVGMSRDTGPSGGYGEVLDGAGVGWKLHRISQEHGTLRRVPGSQTALQIGDLIKIRCQHACLTAAAFPYYLVVDSSKGSSDEVVDVWVPWKGW